MTALPWPIAREWALNCVGGNAQYVLSVDSIDADVMPAGPICFDHAHAGSYDGLYLATRGLLQLGWGEQGLHFDKNPSTRARSGGAVDRVVRDEPAEKTDPGE